MKMQLPKTGLSIVLKISLLAGSVAAMASFVVGALIVSGSEDIVYQKALDQLKYETNIKSLRLVSYINHLSDDAKYLVGAPPILGIPRAIENGGIDPLNNSELSKWEERLAVIFSELIRAKPNYHQIRYIGVADNGKELIRVDRHGRLIRVLPEQELQQKGDSAYFKNAVTLRPGEVYLSDISLNREYGRVSEPHTPMLRAATPVYFKGKLFGVVVINMAFDQIFNALVENTPGEMVPYVINENGYFLAHPDKRMTYGFDLGNENRIQTVYSDISKNIGHDIHNHEDTLERNGDVLHMVQTHFDPVQHDRFFSVILATSKKSLQSGAAELRRKSFLIMGLLVVVSLVVAAVLVSRLLRPLKLISQASKDLAHGREVLSLPVDSSDEIGALARSFDDMRHQLEEKERELIISQGRVHHANKMASLGEMAAGIAHEINSPIQAISLMAQRVQRQLKKDMPADEIDSSMEKITRNVKKIAEVIDSLSKVSRDSTGDDFIYTRLCELIVDTENMTEERFKVNNVDFEVNYHGISQDAEIQCQRLQISQVLINLMNNAYDAIRDLPDKWIKIDIKKVGEKIQISISDSGKGISADIAERIFEPMFTTKDIGKGTGLGLSISNDIVAKHHGRLYIDRRNENTCFILELPVEHIEK